jgi:hypothetical protein
MGRYGRTADDLVRGLEAADHLAHINRALRGRWLLPVVQLLTAVAVLVARRLEVLNR